MSVLVEPRRPQRQDTFDLRNDIHVEESAHRGQNDTPSHASDEDHSILEDDSSNEDGNEYMDDDDGSSSLSIPNESIDFDLVYSLHNFAATVEGQASVVKGDSLYLMDDSNSYWWLVRVLTTQEVGYIPAENIETPFERLARLNKHRNVDLASATQEEQKMGMAREAEIARSDPRRGGPSRTADRRTVFFGESSRVFTYPPAVWHTDDEDGDWDDDDMDYEEPYEQDLITEDDEAPMDVLDAMEPDDGMSWEGGAVEDERARAAAAAAAAAATAGQNSVSPISSVVPSNAPAPAQTQPQAPPTSVSPTGQPNGLASTLRQQTSRERLFAGGEPQSQVQQPQQQQQPQLQIQPQNGAPSPSSPSPSSGTPTRAVLDPAVAGETRQISVTPSIAKEAARQSILAQQNVLAEENAKRAREEAEAAAAEENARKKNKVKDIQPVSSTSVSRVASNDSVRSSGSGGAKLRKGRDSPAPSQDEEGGKKKKGGVFSGLFGRKKDKDKNKPEATETVRNSEDSSRSSQYTVSTSESASARSRNSTDPRRSNAGSTPTPGQKPVVVQPIISQHTLKMQQIDQEQQALYQQYLKSSPATAPEASYGLQSASAVMPVNNNNLSANFRTQGGRPGSLVLSPTIDGQSGVPELSVIRVFAGPNVHTEATFKTVLLNTSTTSGDLIRQAMQRFRLAAGEDPADYYLEIKQVEGQSAVLLPHEKPLGVFENLVEAAMHLPTIRRGSFGSISSVSSNLSAHPAIKKLSMNDFTDDSAVKFYLNRKSSKENMHDPSAGMEDDATSKIAVDELDEKLGSPNRASLTLNPDGMSVTPERFTSPSTKFSLQVFILPEDLPDGMVFDPLTEAIIPKSSLRDRSIGHNSSSGVSQTERRKVLHFPKNTTVAEVIELALERFGIAEGVVDGGDEVEDKLAKRVSLARVRYGLAMQLNAQGERNLQPSSKILDAFPRPPVFRPVDRRSGEKRRSVDSAMLLNAAEDIRPDDPIFILRRAQGLRNTGKSKMNAPLDDYALQKRHQRESMTEPVSISISSEDGRPSVSVTPAQQQQMSRQELIAAQRLALREKQRAILSAQSNSERGVDILLSGNRMLHSSQHPEGDRMRYSYVQDGETIDITDIVEEVQRGEKSQDYLEDVARNHEGLGDNLDRLLSKIKGSKVAATTQREMEEPQRRNSEDSAYSVSDDGEQERTPTASKPDVTQASSSARATPTDRVASKAGSHKQPSTGSLNSDSSSNEATTPSTPATTAHARSNTPRRNPLVIKDDFGVANMMTIIEYNAAAKRQAPPPPVDFVDQTLFGVPISLEELHPRVKEMYAGTLKELDDMDRQLDRALAAVTRGFS